MMVLLKIKFDEISKDKKVFIIIIIVREEDRTIYIFYILSSHTCMYEFKVVMVN